MTGAGTELNVGDDGADEYEGETGAATGEP